MKDKEWSMSSWNMIMICLAWQPIVPASKKLLQTGWEVADTLAEISNYSVLLLQKETSFKGWGQFKFVMGRSEETSGEWIAYIFFNQ